MDRTPVYLDHNASAPLLPAARAALLAALDLVGNPSSVHGFGRTLRARIEEGRDQVAALAGAQSKQVVFTGSATEAITQAIMGGAASFAVDAIAVCAGDHMAALKAAAATGKPVHSIALTRDGVIDLDALGGVVADADARGERLLVALHWVNNETGVVQPLEAVERLVGPSPHVLFVDAVQAFGKLDLDFSARPTDMVAVSGHKIGAPAGIGALLVKAHADTVRLVPGGGQEQGRRGGTEAAALIAAFGAACTEFSARFDRAALSALTGDLEAAVLDLAPDAQIFGAGTDRLGTTANFAVPGLKSTVAMMGLDLAGVAISSGSACSSGKVGRSHVLAAMGVSPHILDCAVRVSLGWTSTRSDIDAFGKAFESVLVRHRSRAGHAA